MDTSVWIRFLANRPPYASDLDRLLEKDEVAGHDLIFGELPIGDRGGRDEFLGNYSRMHRVWSIPHEEVVAFLRAHRLHGQGFGWIDVHLLASALVGNTALWTADEPLARLAGELGVAHRTGAE